MEARYGCMPHEVPARGPASQNLLSWVLQLQASYASVSSLPPQCVVLFVDGFDVLFADNLQAIKASFLEMQAPLLFSAECTPTHLLKLLSVCRSGNG